ncbi:hypothetical protein M422DRAFT_272068 [Sphaerobolus stellatus SS14]|uniref:Uncharacterized protein n=1 Tax=Sphaerobolus stellatus (strain SS14) TaxID=990650 RepID=A0A0C9TC94_SPHS4|nr:hypothetical protein M422DRAFT_272068 [Sphaerobolus stellatus SS14]
MSSSSKPTMVNTILYKKSKDMPVLPAIRSMDPCRMLDGFQSVPEFKGRKDPLKGETWAEAGTDKWMSIVDGYWWTYEKEYVDLNKLFLALKKKEEVAAEPKWKAEEVQKRKEVAVPVASRFDKGKGKSKEVVQSVVEEEFRETCLNCEENKATCVFMDPTTGKKLLCDRALKTVNNHSKGLKAEAKDRNTLAGEELYHKYNLQQLEKLELKLKAVGQVIPKDLLNAMEQGGMHVISKYNYIVCNCAFNMKQLVTRYALGKGHEAKAFLMDVWGGIEVADGTESGNVKTTVFTLILGSTRSSPSKKARVESEIVRKEGQGSKEKEKRVEVEKSVEPEKEPESAPSMVGGTEKGKEKEKEKDMGSEVIEEDTMKE